MTITTLREIPRAPHGGAIGPYATAYVDDETRPLGAPEWSLCVYFSCSERAIVAEIRSRTLGAFPRVFVRRGRHVRAAESLLLRGRPGAMARIVRRVAAELTLNGRIAPVDVRLAV